MHTNASLWYVLSTIAALLGVACVFFVARVVWVIWKCIKKPFYQDVSAEVMSPMEIAEKQKKIFQWECWMNTFMINLPVSMQYYFCMRCICKCSVYIVIDEVHLSCVLHCQYIVYSNSTLPFLIDLCCDEVDNSLFITPVFFIQILKKGGYCFFLLMHFVFCFVYC